MSRTITYEEHDHAVTAIIKAHTLDLQEALGVPDLDDWAALLVLVRAHARQADDQSVISQALRQLGGKRAR